MSKNVNSIVVYLSTWWTVFLIGSIIGILGIQLSDNQGTYLALLPYIIAPLITTYLIKEKKALKVVLQATFIHQICLLFLAVPIIRILLSLSATTIEEKQLVIESNSIYGAIGILLLVVVSTPLVLILSTLVFYSLALLRKKIIER